MDYQRFLASSAAEAQVAPYLGGAEVWLGQRRLRLTRRPAAPGWYRFSQRGRSATPLGPAEPEPLEGLALVRGHVWSARLVGEDAAVAAFALPAPDEPLQLSPYRARRWHGGQLLAEGEDFASEVEEAARAALEEGRGLGSLRGVSASLRAAFVYATSERAGATLGIVWQPLELRAHLLALAEGGLGDVRAALASLAERRRARARPPRPAPPRGEPSGGGRGPSRAAAVLEATGARLRSERRLAGGLLEVRYEFLGGRFVTTLVEATLQVVDAGICLEGADEALTLESLPGVIREAEGRGLLVVTR